MAAVILGMSCVAAAQERSSVSAMLMAARDSRVPFGIILREGNDLCLPEGAAENEIPADASERLRVLATRHGYHVAMQGVGRVEPDGPVPVLLDKMLSHRVEHHPAQDGIARQLGQNLEGWVMVEVTGAGGYAVGGGSNGSEELIHLAATDGLTTADIADRLVTLGSKGAWIAYQSADMMRLQVFSYRDDGWAMAHFVCR